MDIGVPQIIATIALVVSGSIGYIIGIESQRPRYLGPAMFMGRKGRLFLALLIAVTLPLFIGSAIYLGFTSWILCAVGVPLTLLFLGRFLSPIALRWVIYPAYKVFEFFYRGKED